MIAAGLRKAIIPTVYAKLITVLCSSSHNFQLLSMSIISRRLIFLVRSLDSCKKDNFHNIFLKVMVSWFPSHYRIYLTTFLNKIRTYIFSDVIIYGIQEQDLECNFLNFLLVIISCFVLPAYSFHLYDYISNSSNLSYNQLKLPFKKVILFWRWRSSIEVQPYTFSRILFVPLVAADFWFAFT